MNQQPLEQPPIIQPEPTQPTLTQPDTTQPDITQPIELQSLEQPIQPIQQIPSQEQLSDENQYQQQMGRNQTQTSFETAIPEQQFQPEQFTQQQTTFPNIQESPDFGKAEPFKVPPQDTKNSGGDVSGEEIQQQAYANANDVKKSPFRFLPIVVGVLLLVLIGWFVVGKFFGEKNGVPDTSNSKSQSKETTPPVSNVKQRTVVYWGLWESNSVMNGIFDEFEKQNPGVTVQYEQQSPKDYRERLQEALRKGSGPDIFRYHATWVPLIKPQLAILPSSTMTTAAFEETFLSVYSKDLKTSEGYIGVPLMYDGLALFYNKDMFDVAGIQPPKTWADVEKAATTLRLPEGSKGKIERAGIALGTTSNVDNFSDILGLLLLQNGANPADLTSQTSEEAFQYYSNFYLKHKVWDETLPNSTYAFATEKVAMILAPSWRAFEIQSVNPKLKFGISQVPQLPDRKVTWSSYWVEGVSKTSREKDISWSLLNYLSTKEVMQKMYNTAISQTPRLFGEIYSRKDLAKTLENDPYVGAFVLDASSAQSWYLSSRTFDNGINDKIIKYVTDAVNSINENRGDFGTALTTAQQGVSQTLQQYGVTVTPH